MKEKQLALDGIHACIHEDKEALLLCLDEMKEKVSPEDFALYSDILSQFPAQFTDCTDIIFQCLSTIALMRYSAKILNVAIQMENPKLFFEAIEKILTMPVIDHTASVDATLEKKKNK